MRISDWSSDVCSSDLIMLVGTNAIGGIERHPAQPRHMRFGPGVRRLLKLRPVLPKQMARYIARGHALAACGGDEDMGQILADPAPGGNGGGGVRQHG